MVDYNQRGMILVSARAVREDGTTANMATAAIPDKVTAGTWTGTTGAALNTGTSLTCVAVILAAASTNTVAVKYGDATHQYCELLAGQYIMIPISDVSKIWVAAASSSTLNWLAIGE